MDNFIPPSIEELDRKFFQRLLRIKLKVTYTSHTLILVKTWFLVRGKVQPPALNKSWHPKIRSKRAPRIFLKHKICQIVIFELSESLTMIHIVVLMHITIGVFLTTFRPPLYFPSELSGGGSLDQNFLRGG